MAWCVAYICIYIGERRDSYRVLLGKPEGKNHLEKLGIAGRIILKKDLISTR
jgi:hypothetical protein